MTREELFTKLNQGARWDVGVAIDRSNSLPLDSHSIFQSYAIAAAYASKDENRIKAVNTEHGLKIKNNAYIGQILAVIEDITTGEGESAVTETVVSIYYIDADLTLQPVGKEVVADEKTIVNDNGTIKLYGFGEAAPETYPRKKADGTIEWVTVQELVEGATENTITVGDAESIVSTKTATGYTLALNGFENAEDSSVAIKGENGLEWVDVNTLVSIPDVPVKSVNEKTGDVVLTADNIKYAHSGLYGKTIGEFGDQTLSHILSEENPHKVTAEQIGTYDKGQLDEKFQGLREVAEGKTATFVTSDSNLNSQNATIDIESFVEYGTGNTITYTDVKIGDIVLVTSTDCPDRWVVSVNSDNTITLGQLDSQKVDLTNYATTENLNQAIQALDVNNIEGFGAGKTLATLSETDGKIQATFQDISITESQISDLGTYLDTGKGGSVDGPVTFNGNVEIQSEEFIVHGVEIALKDNKLAINDNAILTEADITDVVRTGDITDVVRSGDITDVVRTRDITDVVRTGDITNVVRLSNEEVNLQSDALALITSSGAKNSGKTIQTTFQKTDSAIPTSAAVANHLESNYAPLNSLADYLKLDGSNEMSGDLHLDTHALLGSYQNEDRVLIKMDSMRGVLVGNSNTALVFEAPSAPVWKNGETIKTVAMAGDSINVNQLVQTAGEELILNGGNAEKVSA